MTKSKKSVFNKPMREVKKPAVKKIPVKIVKEKPKPEPEYVAIDTSTPFKDALINLRFTVNAFRISHGDQDVSRANLNLFLADLDSAINKVAAVFEP